MKILLVPALFPTKRAYSWAKYWTIAGHEVTIALLKLGPLTLPNPGFQMVKMGQMEQKRGKNWDMVVSMGSEEAHIWGQTHLPHTMRWIADLESLALTSSSFPTQFWDSWKKKRLLAEAHAITTRHLSSVPTLAARFGDDRVHHIDDGFDAVDKLELSSTQLFAEDGKWRLVFAYKHQSISKLSSLFTALNQIKEDPFLKYLMKGFEMVVLNDMQAKLTPLIEQYQLDPYVRHMGGSSKEKRLRAFRDAHAILYLPTESDTLDETLISAFLSQTPVLAIGSASTPTFASKLILKAGAGCVVVTPEQVTQYLVDRLANIKKEETRIDPSFLMRYRWQPLAMKVLEL